MPFLLRSLDVYAVGQNLHDMPFLTQLVSLAAQYENDLRGADVDRVTTAERQRKRERFKGSGNGDAMRRKREDEEEKKRFKGFRRIEEQGSFNARGGADVFKTPTRKSIKGEDLFREETGKRLADDWKSVKLTDMKGKYDTNNPFAV